MLPPFSGACVVVDSTMTPTTLGATVLIPAEAPIVCPPLFVYHQYDVTPGKKTNDTVLM